jgi:hypothetical protein
VVELPEQTALGNPAIAGFFMLTVTECDALHPNALVSVTVNVVVCVRVPVDGFAALELNPDGLLIHEYVEPLTAAAPIVVEAP